MMGDQTQDTRTNAGGERKVRNGERTGKIVPQSG